MYSNKDLHYTWHLTCGCGYKCD